MNNVTGTLFEMASQFKFRYPFNGMINTEDLWDLSLTQLDCVYRNLRQDLKAVSTDSLASTMAADEAVKAQDIENKIEIVKYIFNSKQSAAELERMAAVNAMQRKRIMDVLAKKQDSALENMTEEELTEMLNSLGG